MWWKTLTVIYCIVFGICDYAPMKAPYWGTTIWPRDDLRIPWIHEYNQIHLYTLTQLSLCTKYIPSVFRPPLFFFELEDTCTSVFWSVTSLKRFPAVGLWAIFSLQTILHLKLHRFLAATRAIWWRYLTQLWPHYSQSNRFFKMF